MHPPLIIASMHRSGSSATTGLLHSAGLRIGTRLMEATPWNRRGHFENMAFYDFHRAALGAMQQDQNGYCLATFTELPEPWPLKARELLIREGQDAPWGWKDPRNVLFLNFWQGLCPGAGFVFLFRNPWCVVDSLYRRGDAIFRNRPEFALACWTFYNREMLKFYRSHPAHCLLVKAEWVLENPAAFLAAVSRKLGIPLGAERDPAIDSGLYQDEAKLAFHATVMKAYAPETLDLYQELLRTSDFALLGQSREEAEETVPLLDREKLKLEFFRDWCEKRELKRNLDTLTDGKDVIANMMDEYGKELDALLAGFKK